MQPTRTKTSAKEPTTKADDPIVFCRRPIRLQHIGAQENFNQLKSTSATQLTLWMHKDLTTALINTSMWVMHDGKKYGILGHVELPFIRDEVGFKVICTQ